MSILLESLSQKSQSQNESVPDLTVTHYDDEMMGDEWLMRRLKSWKIFCAILVAALLASWGYFWSTKNQNSSDELRITKLEKQIAGLRREKEGASEVLVSESSVSESLLSSHSANLKIENQETKDIASSASALDNTSTSVSRTIAKQNYKPRKRNQTESVVPVTKEKKAERLVENKTDSAVESKSLVTLSIDELSAEMRDQLPSIVINSYVVAESAADSFVILDGAFYKVNQVIAPDLILREISKDEIVVEFQSQRIKIPHK